MGQLLRVHRSILPKFERHRIPLAVDRHHAHAQAHELERGIIKQIPDSRRRRSITILQFRRHIRQLRFGFHSRHPFVHPQALVLLGDVFGGNANVETEIELYFGFVGSSLALHFAHGALQHLRVEFKPHGFDVPALLSSEKISRAAQFQIQRSNFEPGAQVGKFFQRRQPAPRNRGQFDLLRDEQVGISSAARAPHASSQLVELR